MNILKLKKEDIERKIGQFRTWQGKEWELKKSSDETMATRSLYIVKCKLHFEHQPFVDASFDLRGQPPLQPKPEEDVVILENKKDLDEKQKDVLQWLKSPL